MSKADGIFINMCKQVLNPSISGSTRKMPVCRVLKKSRTSVVNEPKDKKLLPVTVITR